MSHRHHAYRSPGSITGRVTTQGQALPGALIELLDPHGGVFAARISRVRGYHFYLVPAGHYEIECSFPGLSTVRHAVEVISSAATRVDFELQAASGNATQSRSD